MPGSCGQTTKRRKSLFDILSLIPKRIWKLLWPMLSNRNASSLLIRGRTDSGESQFVPDALDGQSSRPHPSNSFAAAGSTPASRRRRRSPTNHPPATRAFVSEW